MAVLLGAGLVVPLLANKRKLAGWINTIVIAIASSCCSM
jgi:hypothetical protein